MLEVPDWGLASWYWFKYGHCSLVHPYAEFWLSILILKVQRTSMSFKSWFGLWRMLEVSDWGLASWYWFEYGHWSLLHPFSEFCLSILSLKVQSTSMSCKSWFGLWRTLEVPDWGLASWSSFRFGHWSLIYPWPEFWLSILFWRCKEHPCPLCPDSGRWRMLEVPD